LTPGVTSGPRKPVLASLGVSHQKLTLDSIATKMIHALAAHGGRWRYRAAGGEQREGTLGGEQSGEGVMCTIARATARRRNNKECEDHQKQE